MGRPALPKNIHVLKGTAKVNPARMKARENEPENVNPVGRPPKHLSAAEKSCFKEIVDTSIDGVLGEADRVAIEMAAQLLAKCRGLQAIDGEVVAATSADHGQLFRYLSQFGMTPADRSKINLPGKKKKNPFDG